MMTTENESPAPYSSSRNIELTDLGLISANIALGHNPLGLVWRGKRAFFVFDNPQKCAEIEASYWDGSLKLSALKYFGAVSNAKSMLFQSRRKDENSNEKY